MKRYRTITLGCKVNQCESAAIGHIFESSGYTNASTDENPDVVIINTCAVTGKAAMQSRQAIRQLIRNHPSAQIVVTGCYAQTDLKEVEKIDGIDLIVAHREKMRIHELLSDCPRKIANPIRPYTNRDEKCHFSALPSVISKSRTRAFLKIQDGCNTRCTYCIVPYARGSSCSMAVADVLSHLEQLDNNDYKEVVLTGIHLGAYGADLSPKTNLTELIGSILKMGKIRRIRISSIEPTEIDEKLIGLIKGSDGRICRHLHIPLQSGDNTVLRRMGRPYTSEQFSDIIQMVHAHIPDIAIGVDIMSGFPGETQEAFDNSYQLISSLPVSYLHVFPFSPRKGTPAANFKPKIPERITKERCRSLRTLGEHKREVFHRAMIQKILPVLIEKNRDGNASGLSDNYVPVQILDTAACENSIVNVCIDHIATGNIVIGNT